MFEPVNTQKQAAVRFYVCSLNERRNERANDIFKGNSRQNTSVVHMKYLAYFSLLSNRPDERWVSLVIDQGPIFNEQNNVLYIILTVKR